MGGEYSASLGQGACPPQSVPVDSAGNVFRSELFEQGHGNGRTGGVVVANQLGNADLGGIDPG